MKTYLKIILGIMLILFGNPVTLAYISGNIIPFGFWTGLALFFVLVFSGISIIISNLNK